MEPKINLKLENPQLINNKLGITLSSEINFPNISQIINCINKNPELISKNLTILDKDLIIPSVSEIDLVGISGNKLILICSYPVLTTNHIGKVAAICQWVFENLHILKQAYSINNTAHDLSVRVVFVCSTLQSKLKEILPLLTEFPFDIFNYSYSKKETGEENLQINKFKPSSPISLDKIVKKTKIEVTEAELSDFFSTGPKRKPQPEKPTKGPSLQFTGPYFT